MGGCRPGEQPEGKVGTHSVAGLVAGHEVEPARGLGNEMQRAHEHERVALHAAAQDAHCEAKVVEVRQPQQHVRAADPIARRHLPGLSLEEHLHRGSRLPVSSTGRPTSVSVARSLYNSDMYI